MPFKKIYKEHIRKDIKKENEGIRVDSEDKRYHCLWMQRLDILQF